MNRYVLTGLLADCHAGRRVLYVGETLQQARHAFDELVSLSTTSYPLTRGPGQRITSESGGVITFASARSLTAARGLRLDVVFVDTDLPHEAFAALVPSVVPDGELILR